MENIFSKALQEKFWERVLILSSDECWNYAPRGVPKGSGTFMVDYTPWKPYRLAYLFMNGHLDENLLVCHHCDNPSCCNPSHLFQGTHQDNSNDMKNKGRVRGGGSMEGIHVIDLSVGVEYSSIRQAALKMHRSTRDIRRVLRGEKIFGINVEKALVVQRIEQDTSNV